MNDQPTDFGFSAAHEEGSTMAFDPHHAPRPAGQIEIAAPLESGSRIGPYEVREHVGDGGMAAVYKVWHTGLHRFEALKIPRYQASRGPEADFLHRLLAEARTAASLHHPHIVAIHNVSDEKSVLHYFAMEFVDGSDLAALVAQGPLPFEDALSILQQVGSALDYAHTNNVIHRDVKPANILLQRVEDGWHAKVVDFGISRAGEDSGSTRLTRSGMIVGTPEYMSPEQSGSGAPVDRRTDVYSLGVVAYEMMCGHPPFTASDGVSRISVLMKQMNEPPLPPDHCRRDIPVAVSNAILKALSKNPDERFESCSAFLLALQSVSISENPLKSPLKEARRRGTMAAQSAPNAAPTLNKATNRGTQLGDAIYGTPPSQTPAPTIARAARWPRSLFFGVLALLLSACVVWSVRPSAEKKAPVASPQTEVTPLPKPQPKLRSPVSKPVIKVLAQPTKVSVKPSAPEPKPALKQRPVQTARKVQKAAPRPSTRRPAVRITRKPKPTIVRRPQPKRVTRRKTVARARASRPAYQMRRSGEAPLPP